ncbi:winged helix DNA-binding protein [Nocardioides aurantiacus]|uniref:Winged helix DNA-binding protein n=2 Tax=Nocardioides aurantiacus TaxID=86796 RepID=A0A3N2CVZ6_9ACTN|nr:winged helix DNA-binding protein [Nocardioides aurantiacus]
MIGTVHAIPDEQRRARAWRRQALAAPVADVEAAVASVVCLHATEPPTVHLAVRARSGASREQVDAALYDDRTVVKQLAMRRTLFGFPRELLPAVWGSASRRVAAQQRTRLAKEVELAGLADDGAAWLQVVGDALLAAVQDTGGATTTQLRSLVPELDRRLGAWRGATTPVAGRVLTVLAAEARLLRGDNELGWRSARHRWTLPATWLGEDPPAPLDEADGYRVLVGRWLAQFGPGTETDLVWWLGGTKAAVRRALADLDAVEVALEAGSVGWVLPDDLDDEPEPAAGAALLPVLDPTLMGWKERGFYLDPVDVPFLFDTNGNGGTTAWWDGRVVGCWVQDPDAVVRVVLRRDVGEQGRRALDGEAARLTAWLDGDVVSTVYASPQMKGERLPRGSPGLGSAGARAARAAAPAAPAAADPLRQARPAPLHQPP